MHTQAPTYSPLVPPRDIPRRIAGCDGYGCPHTSGVRYYYPCGPFATEPCRPTACTQHATPAPPSPIINYYFLIINWTYTFSAKERDPETGLSYFGSRYYSSDLSIWFSVDPMSDKYASLSPYVYCADNPVKLVDPNGEDWFENELTGDVYYNRDYRKGDEQYIEGKGWKWMGNNEMFGESPTKIIFVDQFDRADCLKEDIEGATTALFKGDNARRFMSDMGYSFKPKKAIVTTKDVTNMMTEADGAPRYNTTHYESFDKVYTGEYALKESQGSYTVIKASPYTDKPGPCVSTTSRTELRIYDYNNPPKRNMTIFFEELGRLVKSMVPSPF